MSGFDFSVEQKAVLASKDQNVIVSAQAGAGKTRVLVEKIIRLIEAGHSIENMLIVTFTKKAANEMKDRIRTALISRAKTTNGADKKHVMQQLNEITGANIQTMHAFCLEILQSNFTFIERDPGFRILEDRQKSLLLKQSVEAVFEKRYSDLSDEAFYRFVEAYGYVNRKDDKEAINLVLKTMRIMSEQPDRELWSQKTLEVLADPAEIDRTLTLFFEKVAYNVLEQCTQLANAALAICNLPGGPDKYIPVIQEDLDSFCDLQRDIEGKHFDAAISSMTSFSFGRIPSITKKDKEKGIYDELFIEDAKAVRNSYKDLFNRSVKKVFGNTTRVDIAEDLKRMHDTTDVILRLAVDSYQLYDEQKKERNAVDYDDLELEMVRFLREPERADEIRKKYSFIFFDEYQDANPIQNAIVNLMKREDNTFFVGDIKQSIYGFRKAEPQLFIQKYKEYKSDAQDAALDLTTNYRSFPQILQFVNFLFDDLMTEDMGDVDYKDPTHQSNPKAFEEVPDGEVHVVYVLENDEKEDGEEKEVDDDEVFFENEESEEPIRTRFEDMKAEIYYVCETIRKEVDAKRAKYGDYAILMRTKSMISDYMTAMEHYEIPYFSDSSETDIEELEVQLFLQLLRIIDNERQDVPLLSVLNSSIGGFSDEEMAQMRLLHPEGPFYEAWLSYPEDGALQDKVRSLRDKLDRYRIELGQMNFSDFGWYVLNDSGLYAFLSSLPGGEQRRANLLAFIEIMRSYEDVFTDGLYGFLEYVDALEKKQEGDLSTPSNISEQDDVVRIMTIHKSKGLEFRNVFLVNLNKQFNQTDLKDDMGYLEDVGLVLNNRWIDPVSGVHYQKTSLRQKVVNAMKKRKLLSEEVRILYVAITRAIEKIYLVNNVNLAGRIANPFESGPLVDVQMSVRKQLSFMQWISTVLQSKDKVTANIAGDELAFLLPISIDHKATAEERHASGLWLEAWNGERLRPTADLGVTADPQGADALIQKHQDILDYEYPDDRQTKVPMKSTVSAISFKNLISDDPFPNLFAELEEPSIGNEDDDSTNYSSVLRQPQPQQPPQQPKQQPQQPPQQPKQQPQQQPRPQTQTSKAYDRPERTKPKFLETSKTWSATDRGTIVHEVLQRLALQPYDAISLEEALDDLMSRELLTMEERDVLDSQRILQFFESDLGKRILKNKNTVRREEAFTMRSSIGDPDQWIDGQIDLFFEEDGELVLVDFKTNARIEPDRYHTQLALYRDGIEKATQKKVKEANLYWVRFGKTTKVEFQSCSF